MESPPSQESWDHVPHVITPPDTSTRSSSTQPFPKYRSISTVNQLGLGVKPEARLMRLSFLILGYWKRSKGQCCWNLEGSYRMMGPVVGGNPDDREESPPFTKEQIERHVSALKSLVKAHNKNNAIDRIRLNFDGEYTKLKARGWFERLSANIINEWAELREAFAASIQGEMDGRNLVHNGGFRSHENFIVHGFTQVSRIGKRFSNKSLVTVDEMMRRVDDFVHSEEAFAQMELPKGETGELHQKSIPSVIQIDDRPYQNNYVGDPWKYDNRSGHRERDNYGSYKRRDNRAPYPPPRGDYHPQVTPVLILDALTKLPKKILATETQLRIPPPRPMLNPQMGGHADRYCDYHQERGSMSSKEKKRKAREVIEVWVNTPITFSLILAEDVQDEPLIVKADVEGYFVRRVYADEGASVKVIRLEKKQVIKEDVLEEIRKEDASTEEVSMTEEVQVNLAFLDQLAVIGGGLSKTGNQRGEAPQHDKIINMIGSMSSKEKKRKAREVIEVWVNTPITFPLILAEDVQDEPLIVKADVEACPKDYYPLPNIDFNVESIMGFKYTCFLDTYKGYHHIQMVKEDEEKTTFYIDQWTNLEAYVDDMVIKSNDEKMMLVDVAESFDNLRKINMRLNQKKALSKWKKGSGVGLILIGPSGVEYTYALRRTFTNTNNEAEYKALLAGLRIESIKIQNLEAKVDSNLVASQINRSYVANSDSMIKYLAKAKEYIVCFKSFSIKNIPRNLNQKAEMLSKIALVAFNHLTKEILVEVLNERSTKTKEINTILNKTKVSGKLEKYVVKLGAYNITFEPRNAMKGQVLADFISKTPDGEAVESYFWTPEVPPEKDDTESWTLFTDEASSLKGSGVGLILIGPSGVEYTYALRRTFTNTNNEAEYKALLAELRIESIKIQNLEAKVDSNLVASQINRSYVANSDSMIKYLAKAKEYIVCFKSFSIKNIPRNLNQKAEMLSKIALVAFNHLTKEILVEVLNERSTKTKEINTVVKEEGDNWMTMII
nr:hypothetical protein [Tanacetum cinerariifolium]